MNKRYIYLLMIGHICTDINQGALPAIIPFLIASHNLSYASAASLLLAACLVSSVIQPFFGYLGDKVSMPWLMSLGIALAGSGIAILGFCESYYTAFAAAAISGLGVALFHPEGSKIANYAAGEKKSTGISVFAVGGNLGFVLGPVIATTALSLWGLKGTAIFLLPTYIMALVLTRFTSKFKEAVSIVNEKKTIQTERTQQDDWGSFARVSSVIFFRSILHYGLMTFIPLFFIGVFFLSKAAANTNLTIFSLAGVIATLAGGRIADKIGFRRTIRICFTALVPLLFILPQISSSLIAAFLIIPIGFAMNGSHSTLIAMGQCCVPNHIGFASGISLGLAVSIGGLFAPVIGWVGDSYGLIAAMNTIAGIALIALLMTLMLPAVNNNRVKMKGE